MKNKFTAVLLVLLSVFIINAQLAAADSGLTVTGHSEYFGNIFFDKNGSITVTHSNSLGKQLSVQCEYTVLNWDKSIVLDTKTKKFIINSGEAVEDVYVPAKTLGYGKYYLRVHDVSGENEYEDQKDIAFSFCLNNKNISGSEAFGLGTQGVHFTFKNPTVDSSYIASSFDTVSKLGFKNVREAYSWRFAEKTLGEYTKADSFTKTFDSIRGLDMKALFVAAYGNKLYDLNIMGMPVTDEQIEAFSDYVYWVLEKQAHDIDVIELWNEPDLEKYNYNNMGKPRNYLNLLRAVHEKISTDFPNVKIAGPTISTPGNLSWLETLLEIDDDNDGQSDAAQYLDIISVHHYWYEHLEKMRTYLPKLKTIRSKYAPKAQIYFTEYGTGQNAHGKTEIIYTEEQQAAHIVQYSLTLKAFNYCDRQYIFTYINPDLTSTLGLLEHPASEYPFAARANLITTANMIRNLSQTSKGDVISGDGAVSDIQHYRFSDYTESKIVDVMFVYSNDNSAEYTFSPLGGVDYFTDMYGNELEIPKVGGKYVLNITENPIYAVREIERKTSVRLFHSNGLINVSGFLSEAGINSYVGIKIVNDENRPVYYTQAMIGSDKGFSVDFKPKDDSRAYRIYIGNESFKSVLITDNNFSPNMAAGIYVTSPDGAVSTVNDFKNADNILLEIEEYTGDNKDYTVAAAGYSDGKLLTMKTFKKEEMNIAEKGCNVNIDKSDFMLCDSVAFFMIDDFTNLIPLSECIKLK